LLSGPSICTLPILTWETQFPFISISGPMGKDASELKAN
jgi:hypothetical protein